MKTREVANKSVSNLMNIAENYGYKREISCKDFRDGTARLCIYENFLRSPYPRRIYSNRVKIAYLEKILGENE